jgi:uncharacterized protein (TIGR02246 family)
MNLRLAVAFIATSTLAGCATTPPRDGRHESCAPIDDAAVARLFDRWNESLRTLDPDRVVANYASNAVLLPTLSNRPRTNHAELREYFVHFLEKRPQGTIDRRFVRIGCNTVEDVGLYTFTINGTEKVPARYTFVYAYAHGQWLISHHHSSVMPER